MEASRFLSHGKSRVVTSGEVAGRRHDEVGLEKRVRLHGKPRQVSPCRLLGRRQFTY
jgi:hypothetical protein